MYLKRLFLKFFRCFSEVNVEFTPGVNLVLGGNAQGKTSLLESIYFLALARSPRTNVEKEIVQYGCDSFLLRGKVIYGGSNGELEREIEIRWGKGKKRIIIDGGDVDRVSELVGRMRIVFLSNDYFSLVTGGGSIRRKFLDIQISQWDKEYLHAIQEYQIALRQRNELLRRSNATDAEFSSWELTMERFAKIIVESRKKFISKIAPYAIMIHKRVNNDENLSINYIPDIDDHNYLKIWQASRNLDAQYGSTQKGPHRDDIEVKINGYPVKQYASRGQVRTCSFALIISQVYAMLEEKSEPPLVLADELLSELDLTRSKKFVECIPKNVQCFITSADVNIGNVLGIESSLYYVRKGKIEKAR